MTQASEYVSERPERSFSQDGESGYASPGSSTGGLPEIYFSRPHLKYLNEQLANLEPQGKIKSFTMTFFVYVLSISCTNGYFFL